MRRGTLVIELGVAMALLAVTMVLMVQVLAATAAERTRTERRAIALQEAANLIERTSALKWDELTDARLQSITLSPAAQALLPAAAAVRVEAIAEPVPARKITAEIRFTGRPQAPVRLVSWRYAPVEDPR